MRTLIPFFLIIINACAGNDLDLEKAKTLSEKVILEIRDKKYKDFSENYSKDFFQNITVQQWIDDMNKIETLYGPIQQYKLIEYQYENQIGGHNAIVLLYEVKHSKIISYHTFTILQEDGKDKVFGHKVKI